jgi:hypothetical protein
VCNALGCYMYVCECEYILFSVQKCRKAYTAWIQSPRELQGYKKMSPLLFVREIIPDIDHVICDCHFYF